MPEKGRTKRPRTNSSSEESSLLRDLDDSDDSEDGNDEGAGAKRNTVATHKFSGWISSELIDFGPPPEKCREKGY